MEMTKKMDKILIVEDDYQSLKFLEMVLSKKFDVTTCTSPEKFHDCISEDIFDLVLMDVSLKGMKSGLDLVKELKKDPDHSDVPVACLSAHVFSEDEEKAYRAGADLYLRKPVSNDLLLKKLTSLLEKKQTN